MTIPPSHEPQAKTRLKLFVVDNESHSINAQRNIRLLFEREVIRQNFELEIVDVLKDLSSVRESGILAAPALVVFLPHARIKIIGDLSDIERVLGILVRKLCD